MNSVAAVFQYFPELTAGQKHQFTILENIYSDWNKKINLISRKDFVNFYGHHVLHSLSIAKAVSFPEGARLLDAGTGGGFPGIPLAILFPSCRFYLADSVGKKIVAVRSVIAALELKNTTAGKIRIDEIREKFHFVLGRAVCRLDVFFDAVKSKILPDAPGSRPGNQCAAGCFHPNVLPNGILYLKGEDAVKDKSGIRAKEFKLFPVSGFFEENYFAGKYVVYLKP